jgi:hypothetical protein
MNLPLLIVLGVIVLVARNRPSSMMVNGVIVRPDTAPGDPREYIGTSPSPAGTQGTGNTNPLSVFGSAIQNLFWPKTTLPGNAPAVAADPAGPSGNITDQSGGTPGTPPSAFDPWTYNPAFDSPEGYFDPLTETFIPHG